MPYAKPAKTVQNPSLYRGRFAPSPTGPLHFGSLVAALGSFLDARANCGSWLVRIEDSDPPREETGAVDAILKMLDVCGLHWDGSVLYQHARMKDYQAAVKLLLDKNQAYPCTCSRREIADSGIYGLEGPIYPGTCSNQYRPSTRNPAIRLRIPPDSPISFTDALQGRIYQDLATDVGDFIIFRADGYAAYQLAVVLDDGSQGITHVVRGADLLISTPRQIYLQQLLGLPQPDYMHLPVALNAAGEKLSKQTNAVPLDINAPGNEIYRALMFLGQRPPDEYDARKPEELLLWSVAHWRPDRIPMVTKYKIDQDITLE